MRTRGGEGAVSTVEGMGGDGAGGVEQIADGREHERGKGGCRLNAAGMGSRRRGLGPLGVQEGHWICLISREKVDGE